MCEGGCHTRRKTLTQRKRIFSPSTPPVKVEQLIAWPRRETIKIQGEKIKTQGEKISYIFPQLKYADTYCHKKRLCSAGKM